MDTSVGKFIVNIEVSKEAPFSLRQLQKDIEKSILIAALEKTGHRHSDSARLLGLKRTTLIEKLRRFGLLRKQA